MPDTVLLHMRFHLSKRDIPVSRNSLTRYTARHLRIKRLVQFIFVGFVYYNALTNCAALLCRAQRRFSGLCSSTLSVNCEKAEKDTEEKILCRSPISQRSHVGNLRQTN